MSRRVCICVNFWVTILVGRKTFTRHASQWIKSTACMRCRYAKCKLIACHVHARYSQHGRQYRYNCEPITCQSKSEHWWHDTFKTFAAFLPDVRQTIWHAWFVHSIYIYPFFVHFIWHCINKESDYSDIKII